MEIHQNCHQKYSECFVQFDFQQDVLASYQHVTIDDDLLSHRHIVNWYKAFIFYF